LLSPLLLVVAMTAAASPTVKLELTRSAQSDGASLEPLRGWLLLRLVEEGYVVVANRDEAHLQLALERTTDGWSLRVVGAETHSDFVSGGISSISALEVLHRAVALLSTTEPNANSAAPKRTAVLHMATLNGTEKPEHVEQVQEQLVVQLERTGIALAPNGHPGARTLCVEVGETSVGVELAAGDHCEKRLHPTAAHELPARVNALAEQWNSPVPSNAVPPAQAVPARDVPPPVSPKENASTPWRLSGHLGAGYAFRDGGNDPLLRLRADAAGHSGLGARLQGDAMISGSPSLDVTEFLLQGGVTWSFPLTQNFRLVLGVLGGAELHHYVYADTESGTTSTWLATLPLEGWYTTGPVCLGLGLSASVAGAPPSHQIRGFDAWKRGASMLGVTATLGTAP
jgi:hypothetical protein